MIFYPCLNVLGKLQNYNPVFPSFPPPISGFISNSICDVRYIVNLKEYLEGTGINGSALCENAHI